MPPSSSAVTVPVVVWPDVRGVTLGGALVLFVREAERRLAGT